MHLKLYGRDSTNHFHLLLYANLRRQSSTFDSTSQNITFFYHIFSISESKISIVGVFERSHLSRSVFRANFRFDFPICGKFQSSSLHTFVRTYPMRIEKNLLWNYSSSKNSNIGPINMRLRESEIQYHGHILSIGKRSIHHDYFHSFRRGRIGGGGQNEGGNRENPFREIVLSRLNASVTPECLLFQNSILKFREKSSKNEMTFQN